MLKDRRVKCMTAVHSDIVLVGTQSGRLWVFEAGHSMEDKSFHCLPKLPDAVLCLKHYVDSRSGLDLVLAGLANGHIAVYDAQNLKQPNLEPRLVELLSERLMHYISSTCSISCHKLKQLKASCLCIVFATICDWPTAAPSSSDWLVVKTR